MKGEAEPDIDPGYLVTRALISFRRSRRSKMLKKMEGLIEVATKYATSKYTKRNDRSKWVRLSGQLIWYHDSILKGYIADQVRFELDELKLIVYKRDNPDETESTDLAAPTVSPEAQKRWSEIVEKQRGLSGPQEAAGDSNPFKEQDDEDK